MNRLLRVRDLAQFCGLHPNTLYKLVKKGEVPHVRIKSRIRFKEEDINAWLNQHSSKVFPLLDPLLKVDLSLAAYDRLFLCKKKGGVKMSPKGKTWHYPFGSVYLRPAKLGDRWYIYYRIEGKRIREAVKGAQSRAEALKVLQVKVADAFRGKHGFEEKAVRITFSDFAEKYLADYARINKKSWQTDAGYLKGMKSFFKGKFLDSISAQNIEEYKGERLNSGVKQTTVNKCLQILSKMFNLAIAWGYLKANPARAIKKYPEEPFRRKRVLTREEELRFYSAMIPDHLKSMVRIFLNTGLRRKELFQLTWQDVDFRNGYIFISETKTSKSRYVPMNQIVYHELRELYRKGTGEGLVFANPKTGKAFVDIRRAFYGASRRAGIKELLLIDLRRTFATRLLEGGVDIITVGQLLGHSCVTTTQIYTISNREEKRKAVSLLEGWTSVNLSPNCPQKQSEENKLAPTILFSVN